MNVAVALSFSILSELGKQNANCNLKSYKSWRLSCIHSVFKMKLLTLLLIIVPALMEGKVIPVGKEQFERCNNDKGEYVNQDNFEVVAINDTLVIVNGTATIMKEMVGPIKARAYAERYERGQWTMSGLQRKVNDFCTEANNRWEPWYEVLKNRDDKNCPFRAGSKFYFQEWEVDFSYMYFPYSYVGPWRLTLDAGKRYCIRYYFDFFDV